MKRILLENIIQRYVSILKCCLIQVRSVKSTTSMLTMSRHSEQKKKSIYQRKEAPAIERYNGRLDASILYSSNSINFNELHSTKGHSLPNINKKSVERRSYSYPFVLRDILHCVWLLYLFSNWFLRICYICLFDCDIIWFMYFYE